MGRIPINGEGTAKKGWRPSLQRVIVLKREQKTPNWMFLSIRSSLPKARSPQYLKKKLFWTRTQLWSLKRVCQQSECRNVVPGFPASHKRKREKRRGPWYFSRSQTPLPSPSGLHSKPLFSVSFLFEVELASKKCAIVSWAEVNNVWV